jgi:PAS domain S-box-containing protein
MEGAKPGARGIAALRGEGTGPAVRALQGLVVAAGYAGGAALGLSSRFGDAIASLFWLPAGVAVAAYLLWGAAMAVPVALVAVAVPLIAGLPPWAVLPAAAGCVAGPFLVAAAARVRGLDPSFASTRDFAVLGGAALAGSLLAPSTGVGTLVATGRLGVGDALPAWLSWYAGDVLGTALAAPLLLSLHASWGRGTLLAGVDGRRAPTRVAIVAGLLLGGVALAMVAASPSSPSAIVSMLALQLAMAAGASWFGVTGAWATLVALGVAVLVPASLGHGPFVRERPDEAAWVAWAFVLIAAAFAVLVLDAKRRLESAQAELQGRERRLRAVFEQSNAGIAISRHGRFVAVNDAFGAMLGRSRDELVGRHFAEITHRDDLAESARALRRAIGDGHGGAAFEKRYLHRDGHAVWARVAVRLVAADDGGAPEVVGVVMDVTERKRVEASLRRQREQLALVFQATAAGIWDHDLATGRTFYSDSYRRMVAAPTGAPAKRLAEEPERLHPDDRARFLAAERALFERHLPFDLEYRLRGPDGGWVWVHGRGFAAWDAQGRPVRSFGAIADVSARKEAEAALLESRGRLSAVIDSALDAVVAFEAEGRVVLFNPAAEALFGWPAADMLGRSVMPLIPPRMRGDGLQRLVAFAAACRPGSRNGAGRTTLAVAHADGSELRVDASVVLVSAGPSRLVTVVMRDARERHRIEAAEAARARAEAASRAQSAFFSRVSHELRTPLNAVLGFAKLMTLDGEAPLPGAQRERAAAILDAAGSLGTLIDELLDLTRIESGRLRLAREMVDLGALAHQALQRVSGTAAAAGVAIEPPPPGETVLAAGDPVRLVQVLTDLAGNAVKFNRQGGTVRMRVGRDEAGPWVEVDDDGPGIARKDHERLYEPFERLGHEAGPIEGSGLGLALSRRLVALMDGAIELDSEPGRGSTFRVRLRSWPSPAGAATAPAAPRRPASAAERPVPDRA